MESVISLIIGFLIGVLLILRENSKDKTREKLNELKAKDDKLELEQKKIQNHKKDLKSDLKELDNIQAPDLSDKDVENFWNGYKDKK